MQGLSSLFSHLECHECGQIFSKDALNDYCHQCNQPLLAKYHLHKMIKKPVWSELDISSMWTWRAFLPVQEDNNIVTLGEGMTKLMKLNKWAEAKGLKGAIWMKDESNRHRSLYFIAQNIVIVINENEIVNNMHEAYEKLSFEKAGFGVFISGPSKTADIEQSLVIGAHGPKSGYVIFIKS